MARTLVNNALVPPPEFPSGPYEEVFSIVGKHCSGHACYEHFGGAWNAIAYRYAGMVSAGDTFSSSIKAHGDAPAPEERCAQEIALFGFFSNAFSVFESYSYGLFAIGSYLDSSSFSLATPADQQAVSPTSARRAFIKSSLSPGLVTSFDKLFASTEYMEMKAVRNILSHRSAPGRILYASIGGDDEVDQAAKWKINDITLDATMTGARRASIAELLESVLVDAAVFVNKTLGGKP
jgi:hypothetical protein